MAMTPRAKPSQKKIRLTVVIIVIVVGFIFGWRYIQNNSQGISKQDASARSKGPQNAPLQIVEFIDFQCPSCALGSKYLHEFMAKYPQTVHLELKYFPLQSHSHGVMSAHYAECAARQNKFWAFHDLILAQQDQWKNLMNATPVFDSIAQQVWLRQSELNACLQDEGVREFVLKYKEEGTSLGVQSTPTYFINGEMVVGTKSLTEKLQNFSQNETN